MSFHRLFLILLCTCLSVSAFAEPARLSEIHSNPSSFFDANAWVFHFESPTTLDASELQRLFAEHRFSLLPKQGANYKKTINYHYLAVEVVNDGQTDDKIYWLIKNSALNKLRYYIVCDNSVFSSEMFGDHFAFDKRPSHFFLYGIPLKIPPGKKAICFVEVDKRNENLFLAFNFFTEKQYDRFKFKTYGIFGIMTGILLALVLFNLISYFTLKESIHLWYIGYAISNLFVILSFEGLDFELFYPDSPFFSNISRYVATAIQLSMATLLMRKFLSIRLLDMGDAIQSFLTFLLFLNAASIPLTAVVYSSWSGLENYRALFLSIFSIINILNMMLVILTCVQRYRQGLKHAIFFIAAISFVFLGGLEYSLNVNGVIFNNIVFPALIPNSLDYGIMIETCVVAIGLVYRFNEIKRERDRIAADIKLKIAELKEASSHYRMDERKRIANSIHDQIGSRLFGTRMHMHAIMAKSDGSLKNQIEKTTEELDMLSIKTREIIEALNEEEKIPVGEFIGAMLTTVDEFANKSNHPILIKNATTLDDIAVSTKCFQSLEMVLREILHNTSKYALPQAQEISILCDRRNIHLIIHEINSNKNPLPFREGTGIKSIKSRIHDLHGSIDFSFQQGLYIDIRVPI